VTGEDDAPVMVNVPTLFTVTVTAVARG